MVHQGSQSHSPAIFHTQRFFLAGRAYFSDDFDLDEAAVRKNILKGTQASGASAELADQLEAVEPFTAETAEAAFRAFADKPASKPVSDKRRTHNADRPGRWSVNV